MKGRSGQGRPGMDVQAAADARQMRLVAVVIAGAMAVWLLVQLLGSQYNWASKWAYLADLAAMAAFVWSLIVTWRIWRRRNA